MPTIKALPEHLINQIAAGEVIERPASVIKELVENSLDAGAQRITIEVKDGGDAFLRITDDGCGMDREDAVLAFERHATSKIYTADDLFNIRSLGFRGEAIASIASVSYMTLQTKKVSQLEGTLVTTEGGKIKKVKIIGAPEGTQIEVRNLFFNTPARKKYLKNPASEYGHILNAITGIALAFPEVAFKLIHNEKIVFDLPSTADHLTRIQSLLGRTISADLIPVFYGHAQIQLTGFIGKPSIARASRNSQYLFVNRREVKSHVLSYAVKQSFYSLLPKEKYPVFLLFFQIDPEIVDVNVHPRKLEVRFADEKSIFKIILHSCKTALEKYVLAPKIEGATVNYTQERPHQTALKLEDKSAADSGAFSSTMVPAVTVDAPDTAQSFIEAHGGSDGAANCAESTGIDKADQKTFVNRGQEEKTVPIAQLANSYILCQQGDKLIIVDQHAAHERIRYTEIVSQFESREKSVQPLLVPLHLELSHAEIFIFQQNTELFTNLGFEIESFGGNTFSVSAVPAFLTKDDPQKALLGLIDDLNNNVSKGDFQMRKERALTYMACRSAVKFGDPLSLPEQEALIKKLQTLASPYTCPHGRPTMITISFEELRRRFGRT